VSGGGGGVSAARRDAATFRRNRPPLTPGVHRRSLAPSSVRCNDAPGDESMTRDRVPG